MNANELADELDACANATMETLFKNKTEAGSLLWNIKVTDVGQRKQAATMLRQQQAEIEALKATNSAIEQDRPYWAQGYSSDSIAAQCSTSAMSELHKLLGVDNQTDAVSKLRQQQAEIEALKKACLDEITKRVYADQTTKVMEGYWEEAQEEIERLKVQYGICEDKP